MVYYYTLNLSDPCPSVDKSEDKYCIFTAWPCQSTKTRATTCHEIYNSERSTVLCSSLHNYTLFVNHVPK